MVKHPRQPSSLMIFLGVVIALLFFGYFIYTKFFVCHRLSCLAIDELNEWKLQDVYEERPREVFRGLYVSEGREFMRVDVRDNIDPEAATDYIRGRIAGMKALYENIRSPYPGLLSNEIDCDDEFKPTYKTVKGVGGIEIAHITGYLNERLTFGACSKDQIAYKGIKLLFTCVNHKQLYDMEFIASVSSFSQEKFESIVKSLQCRS